MNASRWFVAVMTWALIGCGAAKIDDTSNESGSAQLPSETKSFEMPAGPAGTTKVSGANFQIYMPDDWQLKVQDEKYVRLNGSWTLGPAEEAEMAGSLTVGEYPSKGKSPEQLATERIALMTNVEGLEVHHQDTKPIQLADGTEATFLVLLTEEPDTENRTLTLSVYTTGSTSDSYWLASVLLAGKIGNEEIAVETERSKLLEQCIKSFVPAPPA